MRENSNIDNIWREGTPISSAWFELASEPERDQIRTARTEHRTAALTHLMKLNLMRRLFDKEYTALGIQVAPDLGDAPEALPSFVFGDAEIDWDRGRVSGTGRAYEQVTIADSQGTPDAPKVPTSVQVSSHTNRVGPQTGRTTIIAAYKQLVETGKIPATHTLVEAWSILYPYLQERHAADFRAGRGLSYKSFARHLASIRGG